MQMLTAHVVMHKIARVYIFMYLALIGNWISGHEYDAVFSLFYTLLVLWV